jgi:hypothetical protein
VDPVAVAVEQHLMPVELEILLQQALLKVILVDQDIMAIHM